MTASFSFWGRTSHPSKNKKLPRRLFDTPLLLRDFRPTENLFARKKHNWGGGTHINGGGRNFWASSGADVFIHTGGRKDPPLIDRDHAG